MTGSALFLTERNIIFKQLQARYSGAFLLTVTLRGKEAWCKFKDSLIVEYFDHQTGASHTFHTSLLHKLEW